MRVCAKSHLQERAEKKENKKKKKKKKEKKREREEEEKQNLLRLFPNKKSWHCPSSSALSVSCYSVFDTTIFFFFLFLF